MQNEEPEILEKDGSWTYSIGGMSFGSYPSREAALIASTKHQGERPEPAANEQVEDAGLDPRSPS